MIHELSIRRLIPGPGSAEDHNVATIEAVEDLMIALSVGENLDSCGTMVLEHLGTGGRRIRAQLALKAAEALGAGARDAIGWAAACELLHNASLVHDDLQDGDRMRRGSPTLWVRHGEAQAINAGDLLLMLPTLALEHLDAGPAARWALSRALAHVGAETVRGQSLEMTLLATRRLTWSDYMTAVAGKTGGFFGLPIYGAALLAGRSESHAVALSAEFARIGTIFQLQDDIIDLYGDKGREAAGADVREGKISALVVQHLELYPNDTDWLLSILLTPRDQTTDEQVAEVIRRFREGGALGAVFDRMYGMAAQIYGSRVLLHEPELDLVASSTLDRVLHDVRAIDRSIPFLEIAQPYGIAQAAVAGAARD